MVAIVIFYIAILASGILTTLAFLSVVFRAVAFCILAFLRGLLACSVMCIGIAFSSVLSCGVTSAAFCPRITRDNEKKTKKCRRKNIFLSYFPIGEYTHTNLISIPSNLTSRKEIRPS